MFLAPHQLFLVLHCFVISLLFCYFILCILSDNTACSSCCDSSNFPQHMWVPESCHVQLLSLVHFYCLFTSCSSFWATKVVTSRLWFLPLSLLTCKGAMRWSWAATYKCSPTHPQQICQSSTASTSTSLIHAGSIQLKEPQRYFCKAVL